MSPQDFSALLERLSALAARQPRLYRLQVVALLLLGYLYLVGVVLIALAVSAALLILCIVKPILLVKLLKIIWLPAWLAWSVLRAMWIRFDPPQGIELKRSVVPALFAEVDALRTRMRTPVVHRILLTDEFNAGVVQLPRLGVLGWPRNYLMIGLPMMAAMSPDQFRAVLAHEFGHLCAGDSRMTGRIYQQRLLWGRLQAQFEQHGNWVFKPFLNRFAPYFNAYSFVLARTQEYAADQAAAAIAGTQAAAGALVVANLGAEYQSREMWTPLWERVRVEEEPTQMPFAQLLADTKGLNFWSDSGTRLGQALDRDTDWSDTHPCLRDRLAALHLPAQVPQAEPTTAAQAFLGQQAVSLADKLDQMWRLRVADAWRERYRENLLQLEQLGTLEQAVPDTLSQDQRWQLSSLTERVHGPATALPLYRSFASAHPEDPRGAFALGRLLLDEDDESGLALLDRAMQLDDEAIKPAAEIAYRFLIQHKRGDEAARYKAAWHERDALECLAASERAQFGPTDRYEAHDLAESDVIAIRDALRSLGFIRSAWLVRKSVHHFPDKPVYLLMVRTRFFSRVSTENAVIRVGRVLSLGDNVTVAAYTNKLAHLWRTVTKVSGGRIPLE